MSLVVMVADPGALCGLILESVTLGQGHHS